MFVLSHTKDQCSCCETLFSKHKSYILIILQQIIQSQRFKNVSTVLKGILKDIIIWMNSNLHKDLIKHVTDPQEHSFNDTRSAKNELINQRVKTNNI